MNYELHSAFTKFGVNKKLIANYFSICLFKEGFNNQQTPIRMYVNKKRKFVLCKLRSVITKIANYYGSIHLYFLEITALLSYR